MTVLRNVVAGLLLIPVTLACLVIWCVVWPVCAVLDWIAEPRTDTHHSISVEQ